MSRYLIALLALAAAALPFSASADSRYRHYDGYGYGAAEVRCSSNDGRNRFCGVDTRGGVRLVRQESRSPCIQGRSWGYDRRGIWVSNGCRGRFQVGAGSGYRQADYGRGYDQRGYSDFGYGAGPQVVRCESRDERQRFCRVPGGLRDAQIVRQLSHTRCQFNYNWGYQRDGIWVDLGCRAEFSVY
ncbi:MAG: DUF3011 domain-containing protein [Arenimonas sp.]|uniref:DUF3011 domain-containing protein n=1 Tax=Arenimonas sp. TaxID=1872635 RepID=UPI0025BBDB1B|nr:DUF3011 domain-containing protein [Arenimonas sp.]MBW8367290.1 DUF3011 domain-containing protein [Arenimonas sp.]